MAEFFLEDVLEKTRYNIKSEFDNFEGNSRRRRRQQDSKKDPLTELFEACSHSLPPFFFFFLNIKVYCCICLCALIQVAPPPLVIRRWRVKS